MISFVVMLNQKKYFSGLMSNQINTFQTQFSLDSLTLIPSNIHVSKFLSITSCPLLMACLLGISCLCRSNSNRVQHSSIRLRGPSGVKIFPGISVPFLVLQSIGKAKVDMEYSMELVRAIRKLRIQWSKSKRRRRNTKFDR